MSKPKTARIVKLVVKFLVSVSIIAYLFSRADLKLVLKKMKTADPWLVSVAVGLLFALVLPQALRWQRILAASGAHFKYTLAMGTTMVCMPTESAISLSLGFGLAFLLASLPGGIACWLMHHEVPRTD